jgi:hypothetical protein
MTLSDERAQLRDDRVPIEQVLSGLKIHPLEDGEQATEAFVLMKVRDADGGSTWSYRTTKAPNREELLGALMVQVDLLRRELVSDWD